MRTNLQITPSFGARVLIASDVPNDMPLSEKTIARLVDEGEVIANDYSYIKVMINPTKEPYIYKLNHDSLVMRNGAHKILKEETLIKKKDIVLGIQAMFAKVDATFKKLWLFSHSMNL